MIRIVGLLALTQRSALLKVSSSTESPGDHGYNVPENEKHALTGATERVFTKLLIEHLPKQCKSYYWSFQDLLNNDVKGVMCSGEPAAATFIFFSGLEHVDVTTELLAKLDELLFTHEHLAIVCFITSELIPYTFMRFFDIYEDLSVLAGVEDLHNHKAWSQLSAKIREQVMTSDKIDKIPIHPKLTDSIYNIVMSIQSTVFYHDVLLLPADGEDGASKTFELTPVKLDLYLIRVIEHWAKAIAYYDTLLSSAPLRPVVLPVHVSEARRLVLTHRVATLPLTELTLEERGRIPKSFMYLHKLRAMLETLPL
ncbi:Hypothetical protein GLP15_830 [Giardia lamblia P15]|uniref:Uncharacterized protein n=1 Tax=Giardia intestinalis (strain P15) TaxID=658858 RepID=E1F3W6_GIAIA|nr:Hypothetical protein GLP15_830 [Giardia lamblia P15]